MIERPWEKQIIVQKLKINEKNKFSRISIFFLFSTCLFEMMGDQAGEKREGGDS